MTLSDTLTAWVSEPLTPEIVSGNVPVGVAELVVTDIVELPEPVIDAGVNDAVAPAGNPETDSATEPAKPFTAVTVGWNDVLLPTTTVCDDGVADTEKSGCGVTVRETPAVCASDPLTPLTVSGNVPVGVVVFVEMESVELPDPVIDAGANVAVAPEGRPATVSATCPAKPFTAATVAWYDEALPATTVWDDGVAVNAKSGCAAGVRATSSNLVTVGSAGLTSS